MTVDTVVISMRFRGPANSGNGGYVCGLLARRLVGPVAVRLRVPPPLEREFHVEVTGQTARLMDGETVVAEARPAQVDVTPPAARSFAEAEEASKSYEGFARHPFPQCFVCGPHRSPGDGMRIFPGRIGAGDIVAAPWTPDRSLAEGSDQVREEFMWAALDCTSAFAVWPESDEVAIVLGELEARIDGRVTPGESCVVVGWPLGVEGRKRFAGSAVYGGSGEVVGGARATWIEVPAGSFAG
jgi:hypothetical protein